MQWLDGFFKAITSSSAIFVILGIVLLLLRAQLGLNEDQANQITALILGLLAKNLVVDGVQSWRGTKVPINITDDASTVADKRKTVEAIAKTGAK